MIDEEDIYDIRERADHALIRNLRGSEVYEFNGPIKTRKDFLCAACEKYHPKGTIKFSIKSYGDDGDWPSTDICQHCMQEDPAVEVALKRIMSGEFND